jgi:hypothetical protein
MSCTLQSIKAEHEGCRTRRARPRPGGVGCTLADRSGICGPEGLGIEMSSPVPSCRAERACRGMRISRLAPIVAAAVLAAGCSHPQDAQETPEESSASESAEASQAPAETSDPSSEGQPSDGQTAWTVGPEDQAPLSHGDAGPAKAAKGDGAAASKAAVATVRDYLDTKDTKKWWKRYGKHLTPAAKQVWKYTDPERIPSGKVQGDAEVTTVSATDAEVKVPSTLGTFHVVLVRKDSKDDWHASAVEPPQKGQS